VSTYEQYFEEIKCWQEKENPTKTKKSVRVRSSCVAVDKVLAALAPRHAHVLQVLAKLQLKSSSSEVTISEWKDACKKKMLPYNDQQIRALMNEYIDHMLIRLTIDDEGYERVTIPHSRKQVKEILKFKRNTS